MRLLRKLGLAGALVIALLAVTHGTSPVRAYAAEMHPGSVTGTVTFGGDVRLSIDAESEGRGDGAEGRIRLVIGRGEDAVRIVGEVDCLVVGKGRALLGGEVVRSDAPGAVPVHTGFFVRVTGPDDVAITTVPKEPANCRSMPANLVSLKGGKGHYTVSGAEPQEDDD